MAPATTGRHLHGSLVRAQKPADGESERLRNLNAVNYKRAGQGQTNRNLQICIAIPLSRLKKSPTPKKTQTSFFAMVRSVTLIINNLPLYIMSVQEYL
jgi:hypothetical protein